jgi:hypothetical protein
MILLKEKYYSTIEYIDRYGKANKELIVYSELGKKPTIGDFIQSLNELGLYMEIKDFINLIFKPIDPANSSVVSIRIIRTIKDHTYSSGS